MNNAKTAKLFKRKDKDDYFVAIPERKWLKGVDKMSLETIETHDVPTATVWRSQVPTQFDAQQRSWNGKESMISALEEQKRYWLSKVAEMDKESGIADRYEERIMCCKKFIASLKEEKE